jgi:hypothetical protein
MSGRQLPLSPIALEAVKRIDGAGIFGIDEYKHG